MNIRKQEITALINQKKDLMIKLQQIDQLIVAKGSKLTNECHFCKKPFKSRKKAFLTIYSYDINTNKYYYPLDYPRVIVLTHEKCGSDDNYWFSLDRLSEKKDVEHWIQHLSEKIWWDFNLNGKLYEAQKISEQLK